MWFLKTDANVSSAGGTSPGDLRSSPSSLPLAPWPTRPSPFLSPLHISKTPGHLFAFFFLCPDTNLCTPIQGNVRNASVPAASCCCCTFGPDCRARGVFLQGPRMGGWIDTDIEWLMKKRDCVDPALNGSIPAPRVNNDVLIQHRKSVFSHQVFLNTTQMLKGKVKNNLHRLSLTHKLLGFVKSWAHCNDNV